MKSPDRPSGGGIGMKCRNAFRPNTTKRSPSRLRTMMVRIFIVVSSWFGVFVLDRRERRQPRRSLFPQLAPVHPSVQVKQKDLRWFGRAQFQRAFLADCCRIAAAQLFPVERHLAFSDMDPRMASGRKPVRDLIA